MTKLRFFSVLLIASFGAFLLASAAVIGPLGLSDGGGFG